MLALTVITFASGDEDSAACVRGGCIMTVILIARDSATTHAASKRHPRRITFNDSSATEFAPVSPRAHFGTLFAIRPWSSKSRAALLCEKLTKMAKGQRDRSNGQLTGKLIHLARRLS